MRSSKKKSTKDNISTKYEGRSTKSSVRPSSFVLRPSPVLPPSSFVLGSSSFGRRPAYTLAELLIVMTIMIMLVAITLPVTRRVLDDANVREASRELNSYFAMAKARALQTGRPCGVMFRCDLPPGLQDPTSATPNIPLWPTRQITQMYLAEVPPPYSGGSLPPMGGLGRIMQSVQSGVPAGTYSFYPLTLNPSTGGYIPDPSEIPILANPANPTLGLIQPGERFLIRFGYKGAWYSCQFVPPASGAAPEFVFQAPGVNIPGSAIGGLAALPPLPTAGNAVPVPPGAMIPIVPGPPVASTIPGYTYQIMRMPRRIGNPLELPPNTCIDVAYSGIGPTNLPSNSIAYGMYPANPAAATAAPAGLFPSSPPKPQMLEYITVMFDPGGGINSVYLNNFAIPPTTTVHFLVGRSDKLNQPLGVSTTSATGLNLFDPNVSNLADPLALWVSIARTTGIVITSENMPPPIDTATASSSSITIFSGTPLQQTLNPQNAAGQATYLSFCRQLATNREQVRGQ